MNKAEIPRILHQTWKDNNVPEHFDRLVNTWKENHPNWQYKLWTDEMNREFICENYPEFLKIYDSYGTNIQRVDAVRYHILHHHGGVFVDIDFECFRNIEILLNEGDCIFGLEPNSHARRFNRPYIICNAFMACIPNSEFLKHICLGIANITIKAKNTKIDVLESTGPFVLTDIYKTYEPKSEIALLQPSVIYPLSLEEVRLALKNQVNESMQERLDAAVAVHYFCGSWWEDV